MREAGSLILCVDDNDGARYALVRTLQRAGFRTIEAATGTEALRKMADRPDLVVLDVQLPDINGFEVAARLTANGGAVAIVLTSSRDVEDLGFLAGRDGVRGFIPKSELSGAALEALL